MKLRKSDVTVEIDPIRGCLILSAIVYNRLVTRRYYGYTRAEALKEFLSETAQIRCDCLCSPCLGFTVDCYCEQ
jgi:hypothetical protein